MVERHIPPQTGLKPLQNCDCSSGLEPSRFESAVRVKIGRFLFAPNFRGSDPKQTEKSVRIMLRRMAKNIVRIS